MSDLGDFMASKEHLKPASRASLRSSLLGFYSWMHLTGRTRGNPAADLPTVRIPQTEPNPVDLLAYYNALRIARTDVQLMLQLGRYAGLRRAEIAGLRIESIHFEEAGLRITGKGGRTRVVDLHPDLAAHLRTYLAGRTSGYVFVTPRGERYLSHTVGVLMSNVLPPGWSAHSLRRRFATDAHEASGGDLRVVQELLGHSSPTETAKYVRVNAVRRRSAVFNIAS
jgi:integrase